jgi:hypothetical protein
MFPAAGVALALAACWGLAQAPDQRPEGKNVARLPGYWQWDAESNQFVWVTGTDRNGPPGRRWVPAQEGPAQLAPDDRSSFVPGNWVFEQGRWDWRSSGAGLLDPRGGVTAGITVTRDATRVLVPLSQARRLTRPNSTPATQRRANARTVVRVYVTPSSAARAKVVPGTARPAARRSASAARGGDRSRH